MFRRAVAVTSAPAVSFVAASSLLASLRGVYAALPDLKKDPEAALPQLDYDYSKGIPPVMSPRQLELHYTKHHKAYVDKLNALAPEIKGKTIEAIAVETAKAGDAQKAVCNQAGQHFNHSFYWKCLRPGGSAAIPKPLEAELAKAFGSVEAFKQKYEASVMSVFGSGWTWLVYDPATQGLSIINTGNAALPQQQGLRPLLVTDVWEHAWAYQWENRRADYMKELWGITNWDFVAGQLDKARKE